MGVAAVAVLAVVAAVGNEVDGRSAENIDAGVRVVG